MICMDATTGDITDLGSAAAAMPDKAAVILAGSGRVITYRELDDESNRLARLLHATGLRPGDHLAFMLENHPLFLAIAWAAQRSGLYYTAIGSRLQPDELSYVLGDCGARVFISSAALAEVAADALARTPAVELALMLDGAAPGFTGYEEAVARYPAEPLAEQVEGADMLYSSGTTGRPKGIKPALPGTPLGTPPALFGLIGALWPPTADSVVQPAPGAEPGPELARELIAYCRDRLAHYKCPRSVDFRDELPRHPTGKLVKRLLKNDYWPAG
jgi:long-chain acyl-CoA synthetase